MRWRFWQPREPRPPTLDWHLLRKQPDHVGQVAAAYRAIFTSPVGQIVLADLYAKCHMRRTTFAEDPVQMAFKEGHRNAFLMIAAHLEHHDLERIVTGESE